MFVSFDRIRIGSHYSRPKLAEIWGYKSYHPLARGVVTPRDDNKIILFITYDKPAYMEQYRDEFKDSVLHWEGPNDHFAEDRMLRANKTYDEIHVFDRSNHLDDFIYEGKFKVIDYTLNANRPSKFVMERI